MSNISVFGIYNNLRRIGDISVSEVVPGSHVVRFRLATGKIPTAAVNQN